MSATVASMTPLQLVAKYLALRDQVTAIKARHKTELATFAGAMDVIEGRLKAVLDEAGADSMRTASGTFYKATNTYARVTDWSMLLAYIRNTEQWELLTKAVSKDAVVSRIEDDQLLPPGVAVTRETSLNVRRS